MSMETQRQIRENTHEYHEYLKDLKGWEKAAKEKEKTLQRTAGSKEPKADFASRRGTSKSWELMRQKVEEISNKEVDVKHKTSEEKKVDKQGTISTKESPASHTYDRSEKKWANYDVEAALKEIDDICDDDDSLRASSKDKPLPPPRQLQLGKSKEKGEQPQGASTMAMCPATTARQRISSRMAGDRFSDSFGLGEGFQNASCEKDQGNKYFKEGMYVKAIECYSRSIVLQPTAIAYANRAMAAIKIRRFADAELDCSEAIDLDDRYTKAYQRRGSARKELKNYAGSLEDFEFALRLEPDSKELKRQYAEVEDLVQKESGWRKTEHPKPTSAKERNTQTPQTSDNAMSTSRQHESASLSENQKSPPQASPMLTQDQKLPPQPSEFKTSIVPPRREPLAQRDMSKDIGNRSTFKDVSDMSSMNGTRTLEAMPMDTDAIEPKKNSAYRMSSRSTKIMVSDATLKPSASRQVRGKDRRMAEVNAATQAAAARAAASAMEAVSRNIAAPRSSYEFELLWKGFSGNKDSQVRLLTIMDPKSIPGVFKDSLTAPLLLEIVHSLQILFPDDPERATQILENLTKVGRFDMTIMFLTAKDKQARKEWNMRLIKYTRAKFSLPHGRHFEDSG